MLPARSSNVSPTTCPLNITTSGNILFQYSSPKNLREVERGKQPKPGGSATLEQPEIAQFAAHRFGHRSDTRCRRLAEIRWRGIFREIAPALEGPHRPRRDWDDFGLHHQPAAPDTVAIAKRLHRDE